MSRLSVSQFTKNPAAALAEAEQGNPVIIVRGARRVARLTPEPSQEGRPSRNRRRVIAAGLASWLENERAFFDTMRGPVRGRRAVRDLSAGRR